MMEFFGGSHNRNQVRISSTVAILAYISYFTSEHFQDSLGWPLVHIVLDLCLLPSAPLQYALTNATSVVQSRI